MQETEKIWMNGELVDWADAKIHVASHGLNYGSGVFEGIRCYDTPKRPGGLPPAPTTSYASRTPRRCSTWTSRTRSRSSARRRTRSSRRTASRPATCARSRSTATASSASRRRATRSTSSSSASRGARTSARTARPSGITDEDLELGARRAERDPARRQGDRDLPELDARDHGGAPRRLRRGDHALARRLRRRRAGREHLRREGRRPLHAAARDVDPARDHARHDHPDRAGPRASRRGDAADPHRPLSRRRGVHGRHGDRGRPGARGRRPRDRRRPGDARAPEGVPRHGPGRSERWSHWLDVVEMSPSAA